MNALGRPHVRLAALFVMMTIGVAPLLPRTPEASHVPMSFHNRLLLNRAAVAGLRTLDVMILVAPGTTDAVSTLVNRLHGHVVRSVPAVGYMQVVIPTDTLLDLAGHADVETYQIATRSRGKWWRDGPPRVEAETLRNVEASPVAGAPRDAALPDLPSLSVEASRTSGYTADAETGIDVWMKAHPTFDGRGTTIALLETAQPDFGALITSTATSLDGRPIPKLAGIVNLVDPDAPDETRVDLSTTIDAATTWTRIGGRTYILPRAGAYRFGVFTLPAGSNLVYRFGVLENDRGEVLIDTDGDASFQDEQPIADVNDRLDVGFLKLRYPRRLDLSFVLARGRRAHTIHVYCGRATHQSMTMSVAAGSRSHDGVASGVAPGARVLLVRNTSHRMRYVDFVDAYLEAAARTDVDIISDSTGLSAAPETAAEFLPALFGRLTAVYGKPLFHSAGNEQLIMGSARAGGGSFSVGGSIGPDVFSALYGGGTIDHVIVHPTSSAGPAVDGTIEPDFLAPMHRLSSAVPWSAPLLLPKNAPAHTAGPGYEISCCTSASSPYAAGLAALLVSGARQRHLAYTPASLARALRIGAHFIPDVPSYRQGNGVLDVNAAWQELTHGFVPPVITASAAIMHPLGMYGRNGAHGVGIVEMEGWHAGMTGRREVKLRRESGPDRPVVYRLSWTGNDKTFDAPSSVTLPLGKSIPVSIDIAVTTPGVHSALLNVHDPVSDRIIFRTQATIVASIPFDPDTGIVRLTGTVPLMRMQSHVLDVPPGVGTMRIDLNVLRGIVRPAIIPSHTLPPGSFQHVAPGVGSEMGPGLHTIVLADPVPGPWAINLTNNAAWQKPQPVVATDAEYVVTVTLFRASLQPNLTSDGSLRVDVANEGASLHEPVLEVSNAEVRSHAGAFDPSGLPDLRDIAVPDAASALVLRATSTGSDATPLELYLYNCTSGECFLHNFTLPSASEQTLVVRNPAAGRWVAAVNAAPFPDADGTFVLDEVIALGKPRRTPASPRDSDAGQRLTASLHVDRLAARGTALLLELVDDATERDVGAHQWETRPNVPRPTDRAIAGWTVLPIR